MRINKFLFILFPLSIAILIFDKIKIPIGVSISPYRLLQMGILFLMLIVILMTGNIRFNLGSPTILWLLGFVCFALISTLFAHNLTGSMLRMFQIGEFAIMAFLLFLYLKEFWDIAYMEILAKVMCWTGIISGITVITDFLGWTDFSALYLYRSFIRQIGILGEPNYGAGRLAIFLPFVIHISFKNQKERKTVKSLVYAVFSLVISVAILMTGSRMGMIMLAITLALVAVKEWRYLIRPRGVTIFGIACLLSLIVVSMLWRYTDFGYSVTYRTESLYRFILTGERTQDAPFRLELLKPGWRMFSDNPVVGVGPGGYRYEVFKYNPAYTGRTSHNTFIDVLTGMGLFGFIFFAGVLLQIAWNIYALWKITALRNFSFYFGLSFLSLLIMLFFLTHLHNRFLWGMFIPMSMFIEWDRVKKFGTRGS